MDRAFLCAGLTFVVVFLGVFELFLPWIKNAPIGGRRVSRIT